MKLIVFILFFLFWTFPVLAQPYVNIIQLGYSLQPGYGLQDFSQKTYFRESNLELNVPLLLKNEDVILLNLSGREVQIEKVEASNLTTSEAFPEAPYQTLTGRLGYRKQWSEKLSSTVLLQYRRSGSLPLGVSNATQWGGIGIMETQKSERLSLRFGAYFNQEFFGPLLVPLIGFDFQLSDKWYAFANLPITGTVYHILNQKVHLGLTYVGVISSFRLSPNTSNDYLHYSSTDVTLYGDVYLSHQIVLQGRFGRAVGRYYRQYATDHKVDLMLSAFRFGDDRNQLNLEVEDGWIAELRLIFRVWK